VVVGLSVAGFLVSSPPKPPPVVTHTPPPPTRPVTPPISPPATAAPVSTPPPVTPKSVAIAPAQPVPPGPGFQEHFLAELRKSVGGAQSKLQACAAPSDDRWRFVVEVGLDGRITSARPVDRQAQPSTGCASNVLVGLATEKPRVKPVEAEVTVYLRPSFKVAAF
jgi:hypothetical protein